MGQVSGYWGVKPIARWRSAPETDDLSFPVFRVKGKPKAQVPGAEAVAGVFRKCQEFERYLGTSQSRSRQTQGSGRRDARRSQTSRQIDFLIKRGNV